MKENKLIAEFMGYEVKHGKCYSPKYNDGTIAPMQFDRSWDWLMPVLKKINLQLHPDTYDAWRMINRPTEYNIENVYDQVVEFIKEYNRTTDYNKVTYYD
jgi:hypothetical protein